MGLLRKTPPPRPETLEVTSVAQLFADFEKIFLQSPELKSISGHTITFMPRNFFHLSGFDRKYRIKNELSYIRSTTDGMGKYKLLYDKARARNLRTALMTFREPDEVWENNPKSNARWVYIKEYASKPDGFYIALVHPWKGLLIARSSFPCPKKSLNRWRKGQKLSLF